MFIKPNEFEHVLAVQDAPLVRHKLRAVLGALVLAVFVPLMVLWLAAVAVAIVGTMAARLVRQLARLVMQAADYTGLLVVG